MPTKKLNRQSKAKVEPVKVRSVEEEYGVKFNVAQDMNLGTYFEQQGLAALANVLKKTEQHLQSK